MVYLWPLAMPLLYKVRYAHWSKLGQVSSEQSMQIYMKDSLILFSIHSLVEWSHHLHLTCPLSAGVVGAPLVTSQPVSSIFLFSTALWDLANSRPVHSLMLSSHLFFCLVCLCPLSTVPCKMVLARPDEWETCPYHFSLRLFTMVRTPLCGPIACWIFAQTSSMVTWSLYV